MRSGYSLDRSLTLLFLPGPGRMSQQGGDCRVFENKQVVVLGERDGVSGGAIQACVEAVGTAKVAFAATECFV
jgi:hypothetical protein